MVGPAERDSQRSHMQGVVVVAKRGPNDFVLTAQVLRIQQVCFSSASSALTPFIHGYPSSCLPFVAFLCVQNEMFTWRSPLYQGCFLSHCTAQHSDNQELLFVRVIRGRRMLNIFFTKVRNLTADMHQRYSLWFVILHICFVTGDLGFLWRSWSWQWKWQLNIKLAVIHRSFQQSLRSTSVSKGGRGSSGKMFFVAGAKNKAGAGGGNERR